MSTPVIAAGAGALGFYMWLRQWQQCGYAGVQDLPLLPETHARTEAPPNTWSETLYLFKEAVRYMYQETFGKWHAIDLFFGLAYLSRRAADEYPAADIAAAGQPLATQHMATGATRALLLQLQHARRYMLYCQGLRHHGPEQQRKHWRDLLGLHEADILAHNPAAGLLRPAYAIVKDTTTRQVILCVRGTHSRQDMFTSLTGVVKPHHAMAADGGVVLGYSHLGMLAAARWLMARTKPTLIQALQDNPGYELRIVGHSMGGGTAAMLTMMLREKVPPLAGAEACAIACPACMTLQLAASCAPFVTTLVHGCDIVPTFSTGAIDALRQEVTESSWFAEFQSDARQRLAANFSSSLRGLRMGAAGTAEWTQRAIIHTAATSFSSCYSRAPRSCYSPADGSAAAAAAEGPGSVSSRDDGSVEDEAQVAASSAGKPLPLSLRRRGWAWDSVLGRGSRGWVTDEQAGSEGGAAGKGSVVRYLGATASCSQDPSAAAAAAAAAAASTSETDDDDDWDGGSESDPDLFDTEQALGLGFQGDQPAMRANISALMAAASTAGLGDNYVLLEVADVEVYGRMRLNPAMVRDHFIPSYLKAVDNVIGQLMIQIGSTTADGVGEALCV
ncbi:hypothetical protein OEZ85_004555 [Tetradesmus obliquus]|uniref:Fungal lipase-type domain-containing protein n=1 Tax=Tetradesmus obliquus TaxID=3088 RepID=A0ABY8ULU7_TETOB|nr:hypothetical protein OEZ85_004555 [Tetradesmus obliquus]